MTLKKMTPEQRETVRKALMRIADEADDITVDMQCGLYEYGDRECVERESDGSWAVTIKAYKRATKGPNPGRLYLGRKGPEIPKEGDDDDDHRRFDRE